MKRITTYLDPSLDALGASYQMRQALLAIGSGQVFGKGFGQSAQKFNFLPEPTSDSIFAVAAEEFGFVGSSVIILLFLAFALRGLRIAARAPDTFGRLLAAGFVMLITTQSFVNIAAMLGLIPLTGVPLLFISHGGTAFALAMAEVGIILNVSRRV
jgi:cell division protein FtsW